MNWLRRRLAFLEGYDTFPLVILLALNVVDEFDRGAFQILAPDIRDAFGLSNAAFGLIVGLYTVLILVGGLPLGFLGDRKRRTRLVVGAAVLWGSMTVLTGVAPALWVLVIARIGSGLGRVANETVHTSLLTDYYPREKHGRVFGIHRAGNPLGLIIGPFMGGALAAAFHNWRAAFYFIAIPTFVITVLALRLREPVAGETEDAAHAAEAAKEPPIPFARAWRWLFSVPSLKRLFVSAFFGGGTFFALQPFLFLFFEDVFGVGTFGRATIGTINGVFFFAGTLLGGHLADRVRTASLGRIAFLSGVAVAVAAGGLLVVGIAPTLGVAVAGSCVAQLAIGLWIAPNLTVFAVVLPARVRSLGFGVAIMFFGVGGLVFSGVAGAIADGPGIRTAIAGLAPFILLAAGIYMAAARFVTEDGRRSLETLALEAQLRAERLRAGENALLVCRGLDVAYDKVQVLFGVDFEVRRGEIVAILGTNGAGKSTLLRAISGVVHPVGGAIFYEGKNVTFYEPNETAAAGISQVPGGRGVFPSLTVRENLQIATWLERRDAAHVERAMRDVFTIFPVLRERVEQRAADLSGGEQQMLMLAQAFIARPTLLMIDELSLGLAPTLVQQLIGVVKAIHARGTTIVLVEQSVNVALTVAQRAYFMERGQVRFAGPAAELVGRSDLVRSVFLEGAARAAGDGQGRVRRPAARAATPASAPAADGAVLEVRGLAKSYGGIRAVDGVDLALARGKILGIIGPNGAGKTTVFDVVSGFLVPDRGRIFFLGEDVTDLSPEARSRKGLGRSFQDARLFPSLTVAENIAVALDRHLPVKEPVAAALGLPVVRREEAALAARADVLIESMGLGAYRDKFVSELSTGTRRIVDIACALAHAPSVLILDEPSSGIAQAETEALGRLLEGLRSDHGCSLLVIEHDVPLVSAIADELVAMDLGRVIARGRPADVVRDPAVVRAYLGTEEGLADPSKPAGRLRENKVAKATGSGSRRSRPRRRRSR